MLRYDEPYARPRRKTNHFGWTIAILLLFGVTFAAWLGSYYIFNQPERPDSYRILKRLHKIEQTKRFQLTAAPAGEFLTGKQLHERYAAMRPAELARANAELVRNYIRNYQQVRGQVPYVVGRFTTMEAHELGPDDLFTSGVVTLSNAVDFGELLMEHVYPSDPQSVPLMMQTLVPGLEIKLERAHDLSAVIHAERLADGRVLVTAVPLLYGSYTVTQGRGMFGLEPPFDLNMAAGWPLFKESARRKAELHYASIREKSAPSTPGFVLPGLGSTPPPVEAANELVRVESAIPVQQSTVAPTPIVVVKATPPVKPAKGEKPAPSTSPVVVAKGSVTPSPSASPSKIAPAVAAGSPPPATPAPSALPLSNTALASTAGGATWTTYPAGKMPAGRLITTSDLQDVADHGLAGERVYLRGQFVVNFAEANRAVLRPKSKMAEAVLHFGAPSSTRIVVEFPAGYAPPAQGSTVTRDQSRPYEITDVRKQSDGQLNVFVREIMQ